MPILVNYLTKSYLNKYRFYFFNFKKGLRSLIKRDEENVYKQQKSINERQALKMQIVNLRNDHLIGGGDVATEQVKESLGWKKEG